MKKNILIISVILMSIVLSACTGGGSGGTAPVREAAYTEIYGMRLTDQPVELLIWLPDEAWALALVSAFTAHYPNVGFMFQNMAPFDTRNNLALDGPAGIGADVITIVHDHIASCIADGLFEPVPPLLQEKWERELTPAVGAATLDGRMYGVPFQTENIALFYNKDLWGPVPPETWEEVLEFSKTYNNPAANDWTMGWEAGNAYLNYIWLTAAGARVFGPDGNDFMDPGFDSPETARGIEYFLRMRALFDIPMADANQSANGSARFIRGELPLTITGPWDIAALINNGINFGVAKLPTIEGNQPLSFSGVQIAGVSSYSENKEWAHLFIDFMVSPEGAEIMYEYRKTMTTRRDFDVIPGLKDDPYLSGIAEQQPFSIPMPIVREVQFMWSPMEELFRFTWDGDLSIAQAQERAMASYGMLLTTAGIEHDF